MADEKKYLRAVLGEARESLPAARARALSRAVQARLIESAIYLAAPAVGLYSAVRNEVDSALIFEDALKSGRAVYFPRLDPARRAELTLVRVRRAQDFVRGAFGIAEPAGAETADAAELGAALICVPGLAFSIHGGRLGRGGGHYDRMLARAGDSVVTAGLAYSFQVLDTLPELPHDRRLKFLVTESTVYCGGLALPPDARVEQGGAPRWLS